MSPVREPISATVIYVQALERHMADINFVQLRVTCAISGLIGSIIVGTRPLLPHSDLLSIHPPAHSCASSLLNLKRLWKKVDCRLGGAGMLYDPSYLIFVTAPSDFGVFASSLSNLEPF